jgi:hypothetical protein
LNQPTPDPSHELNAPGHLYIHTMMGPWLCVHCCQMAVTSSPGAAVALSLADVPPLQRSLAAEQDVTGL